MATLAVDEPHVPNEMYEAAVFLHGMCIYKMIIMRGLIVHLTITTLNYFWLTHGAKGFFSF